MNKSAQDAVAYLKEKANIPSSIGIISGSGWNLAPILDKKYEIPYKEVPGFPIPTVEGHTGIAMSGIHKGADVIILHGRVHYYEGYNVEEITFPVRVLSELGVKCIIITSAAGGINPNFKPGDFMVIADHINLMGINPLRGISRRGLVKGDGSILEKTEPSPFIDMSQAYDRELINKVIELGTGMGIPVHSGVLAAVPGPSYETPAEIEMLWTLGADAVCMSIIPEVIMCRYLGMKVLGISNISNYAAGLGTTPLRHEGVVNMVESCNRDACRLLSAVIENIHGRT